MNKRITWYILIWIGVSVVPTGFAVEIGDTEQQVVAELGKPDAKMKRNGRNVLFYGASGVEIEAGKVVKVDGDIGASAESSRARKQDDEKMRAAGFTMVNGKWLSAKEFEEHQQELEKRSERLSAITAKEGQTRRTYQRLPPLAGMRGKDRVSVVYFYADW